MRHSTIIRERKLDTGPFTRYKGFDLYPLIYRHQAERTWPERRPDRSFNASVVICREGHEPGTERSRVFRLAAAPWDNIGTARRGAVKFGEDIINGLVPGESVSAL